MKKKLGPAVLAFAALMLVAAYLLDGKVLAMVLILLAALLAKTLIAVQRRKLEEEPADGDSVDAHTDSESSR